MWRAALGTAVVLALGLALRAPSFGQPLRTIRGIVRVAHPPAPSSPVAVPAPYRAACGDSVPREDLAVRADGALAGVVVWIDDAPAAPAAPRPARVLHIDNRGCRFAPHVASATVGDAIEASSSDAIFHNVHAHLGDHALFNVALPAPGVRAHRELRRPGHVVLGCDVHPWMTAHVHVFPHPWHAVTGPDGRFRIDGAPPGRHLEAWHEVLGTREVPRTRGLVEIVYDGAGVSVGGLPPPDAPERLAPAE